MHSLTDVWREVSNWPPEKRLALASRLLQSLQEENGASAVSDESREALRQLIGIWKTDQPPDDQQVDRIVEQERMKKYG